LSLTAAGARRLGQRGPAASRLARDPASLRHRRDPPAAISAARRRAPGGRLARACGGSELRAPRAAVTARSFGVPLLIGAAAAFIATRAPASDSDLFWHLAVGRDIAATGLARVDHFSWSVPGHTVLTDQWLGELALYVAYTLGGWLGVVVLRGIAVTTVAAAIAYAAVREVPQRPLLATLVAIPAIALSSYLWTDRPELFGVACFAILIVLLRTVLAGDPAGDALGRKLLRNDLRDVPRARGPAQGGAARADGVRLVGRGPLHTDLRDRSGAVTRGDFAGRNRQASRVAPPADLAEPAL